MKAARVNEWGGPVRADTFLWYTNQEGGNPQIGTGLGTGRRNARHAGEPEPRHDHRA